MSSTQFGEHLKREREMRGVSLEEISLATRIAPRFLTALENEQWEKLPGGVFNRGFIRSVAHYLGLDEDSMVAEYALHTKGRPEPGVVADPPDKPETQWRQIAVLAAFVVVVIAVCWFAIQFLVPRVTGYMHKRAASNITRENDSAAPGAPSFAGYMGVGEVKRFTATDSIQATSSEASAILLDLEGQMVLLRGAPDQSDSITLTPKNLTPADGVSH
jgi:transcriptional regulator with XRE-family HTH domain